jgi:CheY-like chemotaxis protein
MGETNPQAKALIVDSDRASTAVLVSLLRNAWKREIFEATNCANAWAILEHLVPDLIFVAHAPPDLDAPKFTRELRRGELAARKTPVVMLAHEPTRSTTLDARDAGVHEVLRKPYNTRDLLRHVDHLLGQDRSWIEGIAYVGPDRRRFNSAGFSGARKRRLDKEVLSPENARVGQALRIMKAAVDAIETEPRQALRALRAQADELQSAAAAMADYALAGAAKTLKEYLDTSPKLNGRRLAASIDGIIGTSGTDAVAAPPAQKVLWVK